MRGEKSRSRNKKGEPLFTRAQTKQTFEDVGDYDYDWEGSEEQMLGAWDWYK
jgi:hypothetical protein